MSTNQLADGSITTVKIGAGQITEGHLFPGSVGPAAVADESLTLTDLAGGQNNPLTAGIGGMDPGSCATFGALPVPGAEPGQLAVAGWLQAAPAGATITSARVSGQDAVALTICNVSSAALSVPGGATFRIVTFGSGRRHSSRYQTPRHGTAGPRPNESKMEVQSAPTLRTRRRRTRFLTQLGSRHGRASGAPSTRHVRMCG